MKYFNPARTFGKFAGSFSEIRKENVKFLNEY